MRGSCKILMALLACAFSAAQLHAQQKVAEGEYQVFKSGTLVTSPEIRRWTLTARSSGYLLQSEMETEWGIRVVQVEELDSDLAPSSIGFNLFKQKNTEPDVSLKCSFSGSAIVCNGKSEKGVADPSEPYRFQGSVLFTVSELHQLDFPWLMASAINMAHLTKGQAPLRTVRVFGGAALELTDDINVSALQSIKGLGEKLQVYRPEQYVPWEFISHEGDVEQLEYVGKENMQLNETNVSVRHFAVKSGDQSLDFWMADPGVLVKASLGPETQYRVAKYKQYQKLIPGVKVETQADAPTAKPK